MGLQVIRKACIKAGKQCAQIQKWRQAWEAEARDWVQFVQQLAEPMGQTPGSSAELAQRMSQLSMQPDTAPRGPSSTAAGSTTAIGQLHDVLRPELMITM